MPIVTTILAHRPVSSLPGKAVLAVLEGDTRAHHLFEKGLEKSRHRAVPQREDRDQVLRGHNPVARPDQHLRQITPLELLLGAQDREVQLRHSIRVISWPAAAAPSA